MTSVKLLLQQCDLTLRYLIKWQSVSIKYEANCCKLLSKKMFPVTKFWQIKNILEKMRVIMPHRV